MIKKIIFFIPNIDDGGIEKNLTMLSNYFAKKNYDVQIIYFRISNHIKNKIDTKIKLIRAKKMIQLNLLNSRIGNSINCFLHTLINIKFNNNSLIFSMQDHPFGIVLSLLKRVPILIRIANHPIGSLKFFNTFLSYRLKLFIKTFFYQFSSVIICNSQQSYIFLKKKLFFKKKIFTIYNPVKKIISTTQYKRNRFDLLTIGRLEKQKNLAGLLQALSIVMKKYEKIQFTIVGKGSEKKYLINLSKKLKINKKITFKDFSNPEPYFKKKGIFILNSFFEGLPNVLIEAIQYKIPIIASNCLSGPSEILKNQKYGYLVKVDNSEELAKKIEYVILNYSKAKTKTKIAYKSLGRFAIKAQCQKYIEIIKKL